MFKRMILWLACILSWPALGADDVGDVVYRPAVELARLEDPRINESSGLARCHSRDDAVWTHNDSGDSARLFLIATSGQTLGTAAIEGVQPLDWEDMCSFRHNAKNYLLVGDIGDNDQARAELTLCVVEEPDASTIPSPANWHLQPIALIPLQLHGGPRDCEALAVDPATGSILLAGKSLGGKCRIYQASWAWPSLPNDPASTPLATGTRSAIGVSQPLTAKHIALTDIPLATGMDVSADGRRAVIVSYVGAYEFTRRDDEDWAAAFSRPPRVLRMPLRSQGEAICYGADDRSLYLTSEGRSQPLWWVPAQKPAAP
ncbi:MAG: hypothetical protein MUF25_22855 [Pirellulaceae bacterium]|jgi:hypothetical protein|nr:hypothetical protein [Pirellulaceae bacterium]